MPHLELEFYYSQILWVALAILCFYLFVKYYFYPRILHVISTRENKINEYIYNSERLYDRSLEIEKQIVTVNESSNERILQIRNEANNKAREILASVVREVYHPKDFNFNIDKEDIARDIANEITNKMSKLYEQ